MITYLQDDDIVCIVQNTDGAPGLQFHGTIDRQTRTQYIVDGRRFRKDTGNEVGTRSAWYSPAFLVRADSEDAQKAIHRNRLDRSFHRTLRSVREWEDRRDDATLTQAAADALTRHAEVIAAQLTTTQK